VLYMHASHQRATTQSSLAPSSMAYRLRLTSPAGTAAAAGRATQYVVASSTHLNHLAHSHAHLYQALQPPLLAPSSQLLQKAQQPSAVTSGYLDHLSCSIARALLAGGNDRCCFACQEVGHHHCHSARHPRQHLQRAPRERQSGCRCRGVSGASSQTLRQRHHGGWCCSCSLWMSRRYRCSAGGASSSVCTTSMWQHCPALMDPDSAYWATRGVSRSTPARASPYSHRAMRRPSVQLQSSRRCRP